MEPEVKAFLQAIVKSLSMLILWMLVNTYFGIKLGLLFLDEKITWWNGLYYACMIASFIWVLLYIRRRWKEIPDMDQID